jgi:hypothetical protein
MATSSTARVRGRPRPPSSRLRRDVASPRSSQSAAERLRLSGLGGVPDSGNHAVWLAHRGGNGRYWARTSDPQLVEYFGGSGSDSARSGASRPRRALKALIAETAAQPTSRSMNVAARERNPWRVVPRSFDKVDEGEFGSAEGPVRVKRRPNRPDSFTVRP